ncbi:LacI family DNA-binding transcriptional regulator [Phycicoccus sp. Soil802]|uniref:LacI family DNA-binding transcriptional regulator n=1 Tax=Phycicoccus sp. Soil802 TaxID=1736414 RepID=UPI000AD6E4A5
MTNSSAECRDSQLDGEVEGMTAQGTADRRDAPSPPTIKDVARMAGVSFATVSRVLNAEPHVREETRLRVERAAAVLSYRRNEAAAALRRGRKS